MDKKEISEENPDKFSLKEEEIDFSKKFDYIFGADILYEIINYSDLLNLFNKMLT